VRPKKFTLVLIHLLLAAIHFLPGQSKIIWAESQGRISSANLDGSDARIVLLKHAPVDLVADSLSKKVFWTESGNKAIFSTGQDDKNMVKVYQSKESLKGITVDQNKLYFASETAILSLNLENQKVETVVPIGLANDVVVINNQVYWSEPNFSTSGKIKKVNPDGSFEIVLDGLISPINLIFNAIDQKLYFYDWGTIYKCNPDGTQLTPVIEASYFSLDKTGKKLLLTGTQLTHSIWGGISSINTDGTNRQKVASTTAWPENIASLGDELFWLDKTNLRYTSDYLYSTKGVRASSPIFTPRHLNVDALAKHIYWVDNDTTIKRTDFDGNDVQTIYTIPTSQKLSSLSLDTKNKKIYWTDNQTVTPGVFRMNMDGSNVETISTAVFSPSGIALDVEKNTVYWSDQAARRITHTDLMGKNPVIMDLPLFIPSNLVLNNKGDILFFVGEAITVGQSTPGRIFKVPVNVGVVETIYSNANFLQGFCIDQQNDYLYWTFKKSIIRAKLDGSNVKTILDESASSAERSFGSIQIYTSDNKVVVPVDSTLATTFKIFPNPFHTSLRIEGLEEGDQVFIYSLLGLNYGGQKIGTSGEATILGQNLPSGMSYLYIRSKNGVVTSRKIYKY